MFKRVFLSWDTSSTLQRQDEASFFFGHSWLSALLNRGEVIYSYSHLAVWCAEGRSSYLAALLNRGGVILTCQLCWTERRSSHLPALLNRGRSSSFLSHVTLIFSCCKQQPYKKGNLPHSKFSKNAIFFISSNKKMKMSK